VLCTFARTFSRRSARSQARSTDCHSGSDNFCPADVVAAIRTLITTAPGISLRSALVGSFFKVADKYIPIPVCDDRLTTHLVIGQFSNGFDVHVGVSDESFQFRELWRVVVSDKLHPVSRDPVNTCEKTSQRRRNKYLVYNQNLIVDVDRKVVCLDNEVVLRVRVYRHGHCLVG